MSSSIAACASQYGALFRPPMFPPGLHLNRAFKLQWDPLPSATPIHLFRKPSSLRASGTGKARFAPLQIFSLMEEQEASKELLPRDKSLASFVQKASKAAVVCVSEAMKVLQKPAVLALIVGLLLTRAPDAWAASGGMMGGRSFSSGRSSGSAGRTYSAPRSGFSYSMPYAAPSPFFGGGFGPSIYVGPAYSLGIGGGGSFLVLMLGFLAFFFLSGFLTDRTESNLFASTRKTSVLKLQVGLLGMARSLQWDLDQIAERADTSTPSGLHQLLTETVLSLLRHPDYCISAYSSSDVKRDSEAGEKLFNELSLEERAKFDEETVVNVNSFFRRGAVKPKSSGFNNEYIVVTLLVAAEGEFKLPIINGNSDLKEALRKIGSIPKDQILAVEVLWTPQDENDALSERELLRDYPLLRSL